MFYPLIEILSILGYYFIHLWWLIGVLILFPIFLELWLSYIQLKFYITVKWNDFEVIVPKEIEKTPKAMEQVFAHIHGMQSRPNLIEKYIEGEFPLWASFELVSLGGEIHFYVHAPEKYKSLIETSIYAQYPEAEIRDKEDYMKMFPKSLPDDEYDLWGTELQLLKDPAYPLKTYVDFDFDQKFPSQKIDPLAALAEALGSLQPSEFIGLQYVIMPTDETWAISGQNIIDKIIKDSQGPPTRFLSIVESDTMKAIQANISKIAFATRIRFMYVGKKTSFNKGNIGLVLGSFKQFASQNFNGLKPNSSITTKIDYFFKDRLELERKHLLYGAYKSRQFLWESVKVKPMVLNIEALATLYHFPGMEVRALINRIPSKKSEPPAGLPIIEE